jgi:hypothetical protein
MTIAIAPNSALAPTEPAVGIFWLVDNVLVVDRSILSEAEPYGECITHAAGHYERWGEWRALDRSSLAALGYPSLIRSTEYDQWPRGRVVYETTTQRFMFYADRHLQKRETIAVLKKAFGLSEADVVVKSDAHYR